MTPALVFGSGAIRRVGRLCDRLGARRVLLVTGRSSFECSGAARALSPVLAMRAVERFCEFSENLKIEDVIRGADACRAASPDVVIAVGGGSAIDMAKLAGTIAWQPDDPLEIARGRVPIRTAGVPLIAIPTTAGSGSEATQFAVVYVGRVKYSVASPLLLPAAAVVDPDLTCSLSPPQTAVTGMDAFAQAVESYWSVHSTGESQACARRAIQLALRYLPDAVHAPNPVARRAMSKAAHLAGRAINITKTTGAHAVSYPLTSYFGIPHGHAVCVTLGQWLLFNSQVGEDDVADPRGAAYVRATIGEIVQMLGCADAGQACRRIEEFVGAIDLQTRLEPMGVSRADVRDLVVPNVNVERVVNNPRRLTADRLQQLVEAVC